MSSGFYTWSTTAATNASADSTVNWAEGQAPSSVNDSARAMMAGIAKYRDDCGPNIQTAGTSTAYTLTTNQVFDTLANLANKEFSCFMHATNGASPTMSIDGLTAFPIVTDGSTAVPAGTLISGSVYTFVFSNSASKFYLKNIMGNPYNVPLGGMMDFIGTTVPNSNFVFPIGQAISRSTYAGLFALTSTTYGVGDGSSTFNVPDLTGRTVYMKEASATRLTTGTVGIDGGTLGAVGGGTQTLVTGNLPPYTPAGSVTSTFAGVSSGQSPVVINGGSGVANSVFVAGSFNTITLALSGTAQGGVSTPVKMAASGIILNKILRII